MFDEGAEEPSIPVKDRFQQRQSMVKIKPKVIQPTVANIEEQSPTSTGSNSGKSKKNIRRKIFASNLASKTVVYEIDKRKRSLDHRKSIATDIKMLFKTDSGIGDLVKNVRDVSHLTLSFKLTLI